MPEPLPVGTQAPDFCLPATGGKTVCLHDFRGKHHVVLVFYVGDNTPECNRQLAALQEALPELEACGATVLGINPGALEDHERYAQQLGLSFPLLHDAGAQVAALYGARQEDGTVRRTVYIVDRQGIVRYGKPGMHWNEAFFSTLTSLA
ncbi:MAG: peroxiredoxin [Candidatus Tectimicrobiota bacterium]|nr:MAG: peroxiredoxin [Candidatus Tectomicrobia bacterium]